MKPTRHSNQPGISLACFQAGVCGREVYFPRYPFLDYLSSRKRQKRINFSAIRRRHSVCRDSLDREVIFKKVRVNFQNPSYGLNDPVYFMLNFSPKSLTRKANLSEDLYIIFEAVFIECSFMLWAIDKQSGTGYIKFGQRKEEIICQKIEIPLAPGVVESESIRV